MSEQIGQEDQAPQYVTCKCQHCEQGIEFDSSALEAGETRTVKCPHCHLDTSIFVSEQKLPPVLSNDDLDLRQISEIENEELQRRLFESLPLEEDEQIIQQCIEVIRTEKRASVSLLQRRLRLGYTRAAKIMEELETRGIVGPSKGADPRDILVDLNRFKCGKNYSDSLIGRARNGDRDSQFCLGSMFIKCQNRPELIAEGVRWIQAAAEQGHAQAQHQLGDICFYSRGDKMTGINWYRKAAESGDPEAQFRMAMVFALGQGVSKDLSQSVRWLRLAAEKGHAPAQSTLGVCCSNGDGLEVDKSEAAKWYGLAAENGDADGLFNLGICYYRGEGVPKDGAAAAKNWRKAADQGHIAAQITLGYAYREGEVVAKDTTESLKWFRKAAEQGDPDSQFIIGLAYQHGNGVGKDCVEGVRWFQLAARRGNGDAQLGLAIAFHTGDGVPQDFVEAYKWANLAAAKGMEDAKELREKLVTKMTPAQIEAGQRGAASGSARSESVRRHDSNLRPGRIPIPSEVRREVWRRDGGVCVKCGSRKNLEYDHIVPISKGGSNTARNVELLCEVCNRAKSSAIL